MRKNSFNKFTLPEKYPHLDKALRKIFKENREATKSIYIAYNGSKKPDGSIRKVELGTIIDTLEDYGYVVDIKIALKK